MMRIALGLTVAALLAAPIQAQTVTGGTFRIDSLRLPKIEPPPPMPAWATEPKTKKQQPAAKAETSAKAPITTAAADHVSITRHGDSVAVRAPIRGAGAATVSEPFRLRDRTRLYFTVPGSRGANGLVIDPVAGTGLLGVVASESPGSMQLLVEVPALTSYGLVVDSAHATLWVVPDSTARPAAVESVLALPTDRVVAGLAQPAAESGTATATVPANNTSTVAGTVQMVAGRINEWLGQAKRAVVAAAGAASRRLAGLEIPPVQPAILAGTLGAAMLLTLLFAASRRRQRVQTATPEATPSAQVNEDARVWAARTLAREGLDAVAIARRTGLSRDAATLLVHATRPNVPVTAGTAGAPAVGARGAQRPGRRKSLK